MKKIATTGKRGIEHSVWHDDNGPIPGHPGLWEPPMTDAEVHEAALSDPDAQPATSEELARYHRVPLAKFVRRKLALTQEAFSERYRIPLGTLRDWEQGRREPDQAAAAYLRVIELEHEAVDRALAE